MSSIPKLVLLVASAIFCLLPDLSLRAQTLPLDIQKTIEQNIDLGKASENSGSYSEAAMYYGKIANTYWINNQPKSAADYFLKAAAMNEKIGNTNALRTVYGNLGVLAANDQNYDNAISWFQKSLTINRHLNKKIDIAAMLINIASAQMEIGKPNEAVVELNEANSIARELNNINLIRTTYGLLAECEKSRGNTDKSTQYFDLYTSFTKKIQRDQMDKKDEEVKQAKQTVSQVVEQNKLTEDELLSQKQVLTSTKATLHQVEKVSIEKQLQIGLLSKEKQLQAATMRAQAIIRNVIIGIGLVLFLITGLILFGYNQKRKANQLLELQNAEIAAQRDEIEAKSEELSKAFVQIRKQNDNITGSIAYAQRIQEALLPTEESLHKVIPESFIFLKPRDVVSGDFYWFAKSHPSIRYMLDKDQPEENEQKLFITAADCTGHGVPGAFMSMIGVNLLENITRTGVSRADEILNEMHQSVRFMLKQYKNDNRDGMEMALCVLRNHGFTLDYAGARNPLVYIQNNEIFTIKGDPIPVGGSQKESRREFTQHTINIDTPTCCYIFSDGMIDQFGGSDSVKFTSRRLREFLLEIHTLPMEEQKKLIEDKVARWMGQSEPQLDDMLLMGFKLGDSLNPVNIV